MARESLSATPSASEHYCQAVAEDSLFHPRGGFGLVDVPDVETLSRINKEHPFAYNAETQIRAVVDADGAVQQVRALLEQQGIAAPA